MGIKRSKYLILQTLRLIPKVQTDDFQAGTTLEKIQKGLELVEITLNPQQVYRLINALEGKWLIRSDLINGIDSDNSRGRTKYCILTDQGNDELQKLKKENPKAPIKILDTAKAPKKSIRKVVRKKTPSLLDLLGTTTKRDKE